jgi:hypothetical protein
MLPKLVLKLWPQVILLPQPLSSWDYSHAPRYLAWVFFQWLPSILSSTHPTIPSWYSSGGALEPQEPVTTACLSFAHAVPISLLHLSHAFSFFRVSSEVTYSWQLPPTPGQPRRPWSPASVTITSTSVRTASLPQEVGSLLLSVHPKACAQDHRCHKSMSEEWTRVKAAEFPTQFATLN